MPRPAHVRRRRAAAGRPRRGGRRQRAIDHAGRARPSFAGGVAVRRAEAIAVGAGAPFAARRGQEHALSIG
ncbi:hypothetical protein G6F45_014261 [Rhizopus arrhizus]|nr:hypothetical protein G6F45_014261 [Rhizopus arrhizus]